MLILEYLLNIDIIIIIFFHSNIQSFVGNNLNKFFAGAITSVTLPASVPRMMTVATNAVAVAVTEEATVVVTVVDGIAMAGTAAVALATSATSATGAKHFTTQCFKS